MLLLALDGVESARRAVLRRSRLGINIPVKGSQVRSALYISKLRHMKVGQNRCLVAFKHQVVQSNFSGCHFHQEPT